MALNAAIVFEVQTGGSDTNGGGYKTGATGTDWTQQAAAQYSVTDGVTAGTTTITSATANFGTDVVGNLIYVQGGTGTITAGWYEITVRTNSTTITVDRSTGLTAGTGVTLIIGGALASLGQACAIATVAGHIVYQKNGTYTISSASTNIATGCLAPSAGVMLIGYSSSRTTTNSGTHPLNQFGAVSTMTFFTTSNSFYAHNIDVDGAVQTASKGSSASQCIFDHCKFSNCVAGGGVGSGGTSYYFCEFTGCTTVAACSGGSIAYGCEAYANTFNGFSGITCINCLSYGNTGATTDGFVSAGILYLQGCVAYNNGRDGFRINSGNVKGAINCIAEGNAAFGYTIGNSITVLNNCAAFNNTSGRISGTPIIDAGVTTCTVSPFTNAAGNDFSLNNTAGGGAALRALAYPGTFPRGNTTGYLDIGAVQHQDSGGSSSIKFRNDMQGNLG